MRTRSLLRRPALPTALATLAGLLLPVPPILASDDPPGGEFRVERREIETAEEIGSVLVVVERTGDDSGDVSVEYATVDGSATAGGDYEATSGVLSWGDGDDSDRTIAISILDDDQGEGEETFLVVLANPSPGAGIRGDRAATAITIEPSDGGAFGPGGPGGPADPPVGDAGLIKFDQRSFVSLEGQPNAVITVERSKGEDGAVSVSFSTADGTATAGEDYEATTATLEWGDGDGTLRTVLIPLVDDSLAEGTETVELILEAPTGGAVLDPVRGTAVLDILDDEAPGPIPPTDEDRPGTIKFDELSFEFVESAGEALIVVERSMGEAGAVTVDVVTSDGSATDGEDYTGTAVTLSWGPGDGSDRVVAIPLLDDDLTEGNETVLLELANVTGGAELSAERGTSTLVILDDDGSTAACVPGPTTLCLQQSRFRVETVFRAPDGSSGRGRVEKLSDSSGSIWFFDSGNVELLFKALDGCGVGGLESYWMFFSATTDVDFTVTVTDTATGLTKQYANLQGALAAPVRDLVTFRDCPR